MSVTEIAHLAGVSQATVSKVINEYPSVSLENTRRVQEAMRQLNYVPTARRRKNPLKHGVVAVLLLFEHPHHFFNPNFASSLKGIEQALREHGGDVLLANVSHVADLPNLVRKRRVDGLILAGHQPSDAVLEQIKDIPSVWLTSHQEPTGDVTLAGNEDVGRLAAEYLIQRSHKHLGIFNSLGSNAALDLRFRYFTFIAQEQGCKVDQFITDPKDVPRASSEIDLAMLEQQVDKQVARLLAQKQRPTGLFVPFDIQVAMLYRVLQKRGETIAGNLDIIGDTDDKRTLVGLVPRPATINTAPQVMGRHAVEQLILRLRNGDTGRQVRVVVEPKLVPGDDRPTDKP